MGCIFYLLIPFNLNAPYSEAMNRKHAFLAASVLFGFTSALASTVYFVKGGDTLSQISADHIGHPIYGTKGSLSRVLSVNPEVHNQDKIFVGDELILTKDGILIKRLATPEQLAAAEAETEAYAEPTPYPTPEPLTVPESLKPAPLPHGTLSLRGSIGPTYYNLSQTGALGTYSQDAVRALGVSANILATFGDGRIEFEYKRIGPDFNEQTKEIQNFLIKGGYEFIVFGIDESTSPVAGIQAGTVAWKDLTLVSPLLGVHFDWGYEKYPLTNYRKSVDVEAELPAWTIKDNTQSYLDSTGIGGYEIRVRGRVERSIFSAGKFNLYLGIEAAAAYQDLHFYGTLGTVSGRVDRKLGLYQALVTLNAEL
jgi:hypothetical protein